MTKKLTIKKAHKLLERAIAEKGESYVYDAPDGSDTCVYAVEDDEGNLAPSCIVGHVLNYLDPEALQEAHFYEGHRAYFLRGAMESVSIPDETARYLNGIQTEQDSGVTWGEAVHAYDYVLGDEAVE